MFFDDNGVYKQVGVVSGGDSDITLEDFPGVFTKVPLYREWMDSIMNNYDITTSLPSNKKENQVRIIPNKESVSVGSLSINDEYIINIYMMFLGE